MFFKGLKSCLPAATEVVSEMSAILPDRGDRKKGELDFFVNSVYFYWFELMRHGRNFKEHRRGSWNHILDNQTEGSTSLRLFRTFGLLTSGKQAFDQRTMMYSDWSSYLMLLTAGVKCGRRAKSSSTFHSVLPPNDSAVSAAIAATDGSFGIPAPAL